MYIIMAILGFSLLIIVHEFGHYIVARMNKVKVHEFAIGMGPKIFSYQGKETVFSLRLLPIGGFVDLYGENESINDKGSFSSIAKWRRITILLAGAFMNLVFAVGAYTVVNYNIGLNETTIKEVSVDSPAYEAGLQEGDKILKVNGSKAWTSKDVILEVNLAKDTPVNFLVDRNGEKKELTITPKLFDNNTYLIGIIFDRVQNPSLIESLTFSFKSGISDIVTTFKSLGMMITGEANLMTDVGGPVTIIKMTGQAAKNGMLSLFNLLAFISVNLAVMNLLPIPVLDGGTSVMLLLEMISGKEIPEKIKMGITNVFWVLLMGFMAFICLKDIFFPIQF